MTQIMQFRTREERLLTLAILEGIKTDLGGFSHPSVSEPELDIRHQVLDNCRRLAQTTTYEGEYAPWRERSNRQSMIVATVLSVFFVGLGAVEWWVQGWWVAGIGEFVFAAVVWGYNYLWRKFMGHLEYMDQLKLKLPPNVVKLQEAERH